MKLLLAPFDYYSKRDHRNENISEMKLLLVPFGYYSERDHKNENISEMKLLLVPFDYYSKKMLDDVYKHYAIIFV